MFLVFVLKITFIEIACTIKTRISFIILFGRRIVSIPQIVIVEIKRNILLFFRSYLLEIKHVIL